MLSRVNFRVEKQRFDCYAYRMPTRILLVDDDSLNSHALKDHLESVGFEVAWADGCEQAAAMLRSKEKFDLMLLDYLMADGNGTDLLQWIVREAGFQRPPVVMYSSIVEQNDPNWQALLHRLPALSQSLIQAYVQKPFSFEQIEGVLRRILHAQPDPNQLLSGDFQSSPAIRPKKDAA
jgi:CheY-like chemotaxis protein